MTVTKVVQGKKLELYSRRINNTGYVVYNDKIWEETGSQGAGINYVQKLERKENNCSIVKWLKGEEFKKVLFVVSPKGYIDTNEDVKVVTKLQYVEFLKVCFSTTKKIGKLFCEIFNIDNEELAKKDKSEALEIIARYLIL